MWTWKCLRFIGGSSGWLGKGESGQWEWIRQNNVVGSWGLLNNHRAVAGVQSNVLVPSEHLSGGEVGVEEGALPTGTKPLLQRVRVSLFLETLGRWKGSPRWLSGSNILDWAPSDPLVLMHLLTDKETKSLQAEVSCLLKYNFQKGKNNVSPTDVKWTGFEDFYWAH